jgi:hypothetical protein
MMASRGRMLVLGGRGAGPMHNNPPFKRRVNMALRGVACVTMGLLPGPQSGAIEEYSNMAATKKKHVMDKDRRMQNTPLGFVVPEGGAAVVAAEPHFTDLEEVLQGHAAVAHRLRDKMVDLIKGVTLPMFLSTALQRDNKVGDDVLNAIVCFMGDQHHGRPLSPIEQQTLRSYNSFRVGLGFQELLHGQVGPTFISALGIAWPEVAKRMPIFEETPAAGRVVAPAAAEGSAPAVNAALQQLRAVVHLNMRMRAKPAATREAVTAPKDSGVEQRTVDPKVRALFLDNTVAYVAVIYNGRMVCMGAGDVTMADSSAEISMIKEWVAVMLGIPLLQGAVHITVASGEEISRPMTQGMITIRVKATNTSPGYDLHLRVAVVPNDDRMPDVLLATYAMHSMGFSLHCGDYTAGYTAKGEDFQLPLLWAAAEEPEGAHTTGMSALQMMARVDHRGDENGRWRHDPLLHHRAGARPNIVSMCERAEELLEGSRIFPLWDDQFCVDGLNVERDVFLTELISPTPEVTKSEEKTYLYSWEGIHNPVDTRQPDLLQDFNNRDSFFQCYEELVYQPALGGGAAAPLLRQEGLPDVCRHDEHQCDRAGHGDLPPTTAHGHCGPGATG